VDVTCEYALGTGITFNQGTAFEGSLDDIYYLTRVRGLDGIPRRTVSDRKSQTDGEILHSNKKGARHPAFEGVFLIQSVRRMTLIREKRNEMDAALRAALDAAGDASTSLAWTPYGESALSLVVWDKGEYATDYDQEYRAYTFSFGLIAPDPDF